MKAEMKRTIPLAFTAGRFLVPAAASARQDLTSLRRQVLVETMAGLQTVNRWDRLPPVTGFVWTAASRSASPFSMLEAALPLPNHTPAPSDRAVARMNVAVLPPTLDRINRPAMRARTRAEPKLRRFGQPLSRRPSMDPKKILE
jgi:hypothetical protein